MCLLTPLLDLEVRIAPGTVTAAAASVPFKQGQCASKNLPPDQSETTVQSLYAANTLVQPVLPTPLLLDAQTCNVRYAQKPLFMPRICLELHVNIPDDLPQEITQTLQAKSSVKMVNLHNRPVFASMKAPTIEIGREYVIG